MTFDREFQRIRAREWAEHGQRFAGRLEQNLAEQLDRLPYSVQSAALRAYETERARGSHLDAQRALSSVVQLTRSSVAEKAARMRERMAQERDELPDFASDATVKAWARRRAGEAAAQLRELMTWADAYARLESFARAWGVAPPRLGGAVTEEGAARRMMAARWWTRQARKMLTARIEARELAAGRVHRRAALYVSNRNVARAQEAARRNRQLMLDLLAVNELGETFQLAELAERSIANPHIRFCELMVRIKGLEAHADARGWGGLFLTWTLPSRFHARLSASGERNASHDGSLPADGQRYLCRAWARVRALVQKRELPMFGLRVAEPHHDGTPHWHLLVFAPVDRLEELAELVRAYALRDDAEELGASEHRFKVERIEKAKGGAASYLAKYVSKMTTGARLGEGKERGADGETRSTGKATDAAKRARIWAATHRIRQFQFFGAPAVGIWRELRRRRDVVTAEDLPQAAPEQLELFELARAAADRSDYAAHLDALGGAGIPRELVRLQLGKEARELPNDYGELGAPRVVGVTMGGRLTLRTRQHVWTLQPRGRVSAPWTRVNNCNREEERQCHMAA